MPKLTLTPQPMRQQLPLPWPELEPPHPPLLPDGPCQPPQQIWLSLSPATQAQVRTTLLRLIQEVLHEAAQP